MPWIPLWDKIYSKRTIISLIVRSYQTGKSYTFSMKTTIQLYCVQFYFQTTLTYNMINTHTKFCGRTCCDLFTYIFTLDTQLKTQFIVNTYWLNFVCVLVGKSCAKPVPRIPRSYKPGGPSRGSPALRGSLEFQF